MKLTKLLSIIFFSLAMSGCQTWNHITKEEPVVVPNSTTKITLPMEWTQLALVADRLLASRDGFEIQYIEVIEGKSETVFKDTEVKFEANAIPEDAAKSVISYVKETAGFVDVDVIENSPATIDGKDGFKLHLTFKNEKGVRYERLVYGTVIEEKMFLASYQAPTLHFFERDLPTFERAVKSVSL